MSDGLDAWRRRLSIVRRALKDSAPTGGGGTPAHLPAKPPDALGVGASTPAAGGEVSPFAIPPPSEVRAVTLNVKQLRREVRIERLRPDFRDPEPVDRPKTRGECEGGPRPCPLVGCRHHTAVDVSDSGSLKLNHPDTEVEQLGASCSLDVADAGPATLEQVGQVLNVTRERARQIETSALQKVRAKLEPKFRGSCKALCAETGLRCRLPAHGPEQGHRHERGQFILVAAEGQRDFVEKRRVELSAVRNSGDGAVYVG